jgi:hypothetical protein
MTATSLRRSTDPSHQSLFHRFVRRGDDAGVALITALMVMLVLLAFGALVTVLGVNNLGNSNRDRAASSSLGAGDAGVAQAIEYIRNNGVGKLTCPDANPSSCSGNPAGWSNPISPKLVPLDSGQNGCSGSGKNCAKVWIGIVQAFAPPTVKSGTYNIHSEGLYGNGPSARQIVVTIKVTPDKFPIGVFGQTVSGNGGTAVYTESLFTTDCVSPIDTGSGNGTRFTGIDSYWGQPAAAHTTTHISSSVHCGSNGYITHGSPTATSPSANNCPNNTTLNPMQSGDGGLVDASVGSQCYQIYHRPDGSWYPDGVCPSGVTPTYPNGLCATTAFTTADLQRFGYRPRGLSDAEYAALKARARSQGTYNIAVGSLSSTLTSLVNGGVNSPVLYWDCSSASMCSSSNPLSLKYSDFPSGMFADAPSDSCSENMRVLTIVVEHANFVFQGGNNTWFDAAIFVPDGSFYGNGGYQVLGTLFSNNLDLGGTQAFALNSCWLNSFPGPVLSVTQTGFRENDSADVP